MLSTGLKGNAFLWKDVILKKDNQTVNGSQIVHQGYKKIWKNSVQRSDYAKN